MQVKHLSEAKPYDAPNHRFFRSLRLFGAEAGGPQRNGPLHPHLAEEYRQWSGGRDWKDDFPDWEPVHRILFKNGILGIENVGGDIDKVTGRRCTFALFPWNWERGDGCIIRLVAIIDPKGSYRIERGEKF